MATRDSRSRSARKADQEFVSEAEEILERMREDYLDLDDQRAAGGDVDPDLINRLFRSAHSLKALAGACLGSSRSRASLIISRTFSTVCGSVGCRWNRRSFD